MLLGIICWNRRLVRNAVPHQQRQYAGNRGGEKLAFQRTPTLAPTTLGFSVSANAPITVANGKRVGPPDCVNLCALRPKLLHSLIDETEPLSDPTAMRSTLGLPIGQDYQLLLPSDLLHRWQARRRHLVRTRLLLGGSDSPSAYAGLFRAGRRLIRPSLRWPRWRKARRRWLVRCSAHRNRCGRSSVMSNQPSTGL